MSKENLKVTITKKDYKGTDYHNNLDCPLARAVRRTLKLKKEDEVGVDIVSVRVETKKGTIFYNNGVFGYPQYLKLETKLRTNPKATMTVTLKPSEFL